MDALNDLDRTYRAVDVAVYCLCAAGLSIGLTGLVMLRLGWPHLVPRWVPWIGPAVIVAGVVLARIVP